MTGSSETENKNKNYLLFLVQLPSLWAEVGLVVGE